MKIAALTGIGQIGLNKAPVPKIKHPKDVLLKVKAVRICGSDIHSIRRNEISIFNVRRQNDCVNSTINFISENTETKKLITHTFNSNEIPEAYKLVSEYSDEVIKAVIQFD